MENKKLLPNNSVKAFFKLKNYSNSIQYKMEKIYNFTTKRYVNKDGKIGRKIIERHTEMWKYLFESDIFAYVVLFFCDIEDITNLLFMSKIMNNAVRKHASCVYKKTYNSHSSDSLCWLMNSNKKITKTHAKIKYRLTNDILDKIEYTEKWFYFYGVTGRLYDLKDIIHHAILLHGSLLSLKSRHEEKNIRLQQKLEVREKRREDLVYELSQVKLVIRTDSKLCQLYIDGKETNLKYVVERMCQMKYLFEYFPFKKYINIARQEYGYIDEPIHEFIERKYVNYPKIWPWMK